MDASAAAPTGARLAWVALGLGALAAVALAGPLAAAADSGVVLCVFRRLTGVPCPGCGLTRAFAALAGGDLRAAIALHPLAPLLALELAAIWALAGLGRRWRRWRAALPAVALANAVALLAVWGLRLLTGSLP